MSEVENLESPVGVWEVSTEGDCEGRTTKQLGIHKGHIIDIAFNLSGEVAYGLSFKPRSVEKAEKERPRRNKCTISLPVNTKTWPQEMNSEERAVAIGKFLSKERPLTDGVKVVGSPYYSCVLLEKTATQPPEVKT